MTILSEIIKQIEISKKEKFDNFEKSFFDLSIQKERTPIDILSQISNTFFLICETKKASPSKGIIRPNYDPLQIAKSYEKAKANAISVITEKDFFMGDIEHLKLIRKEVRLPLLRKDFIIHQQQILEAYQYGADMVLLIASCLDEKKLLELKNYIESFGMTALIEIHNEEDLQKTLSVNPQLIGINNRDLKTFEVDLNICLRLRKKIPSSLPTIAESGISTHEDITLLQENNFQGALVGESLLRQSDIAHAVKKLMSPSC